MMPGSSEPYAIGSMHWPGFAKLLEEDGELAQVIGKILAFPEGGEHPDEEGDLTERLENEMADLQAAIDYTSQACRLNRFRIADRKMKKLTLFWQWHHEERNTGGE